MTDRNEQARLDGLALKYLTALDAGDFDAIGALWEQAEGDPDLAAMLHGLNAERVAEQEEAEREAVTKAVTDQIRKHMPSAEVVRPVTGPLTVAEVADYLFRHPPPGLTTDDLRLNDALRARPDAVPVGLGLSEVLGWGSLLGVAPEAYWRAFRDAAIDLAMRRSTPENYQLAARPRRPKRPGGGPKP